MIFPKSGNIVNPKMGRDENVLRRIIPAMGHRLKELRAAQNWTLDQAADALGVSRGGYIKIERGERRLALDRAERAARVYGVDLIEVLGEDPPERNTVPLVGYVSAGAIAVYYGDGDGASERVPAPAGATDDTVAVEVRGTSMGELFDRWLVFYDDRRERVSPDMMGKLCVAGLEDGRVVVKKIVRGQLPGKYTLLSNTEQPMYDQKIIWAAIVKQMTPR